jgi:hypothetical protein
VVERRKMIIFTEHKDTLDYLVKKIAGVVGNPEFRDRDPRRVRRDGRPLDAQERFPAGARSRASSWPPMPPAKA